MRIEMVVNSLPVAGLETVVAELVRGLSRRGHEVGVTCLAHLGGLGERLVVEGYRVSVVDASGLVRNIRPVPLVRWLRALQPDVVHVHSGVWLKGVTGASQAGVPRRLYTLHGIYPVEPWHLPLTSRLAARRTDLAVAVSDSLAGYLERRIRLPKRKIRVIQNGIDVTRFAPGPKAADVAERLGIPAAGFVVGTVGRLHPVKNQMLLLDAFAGFQRVWPDSVLVIVGDGSLRTALEARARALGIAQRVVLTGPLTDPASAYRLFDLFALSSIIEGTSVSALEAMSSGVPVVATSVGGNPQLLEEGKAGILVPSGDPVALASALTGLASDASRRRELARYARQRVLDHYSVDTMVSAYEAAYVPASAGRAAKPAGRRAGLEC